LRSKLQGGGLLQEGRPVRKALGIFAKDPRPGKVKTRLCPPLRPSEAAGLYRASLQETVAAMAAEPFDQVLFYSGGADFFREAFPGVAALPQGEGDLGERMSRALGRLHQRGAQKAALIGSDSPDLPPAVVEVAFAALEEAEFVTAPARDGGYVLVGSRREFPLMFRDIPWSTPDVLAATRRRAAKLALSYREVPGWEDFDDLESLRRLIGRSPGSATGRLAVEILQRHGL
jgi:rSAM/selenodomain-associated transferase 1